MATQQNVIEEVSQDANTQANNAINTNTPAEVDFDGVIPAQAIDNPVSVEIPETTVGITEAANQAIADEALKAQNEALSAQTAADQAEADFRQQAEGTNITAQDFITQSQGITNQIFTPEERSRLQGFVEAANADSAAISRLNESVREGRGVQKSIARGQVAREKALLQISQTANLANAAFLQGNLERAQELASQAMGVEINSKQNALENEKMFLQRNYDKLDNAEKKQADARLLEISSLQSQAEEVKEIGANAILNGAPKSLIQQISQADSASKARELAGNFASDPLTKSKLRTEAMQRANLQSQIDSRNVKLASELNTQTFGSDLAKSVAAENIGSVEELLASGGLETAVGTSILSRSPKGFWGTVGKAATGFGAFGLIKDAQAKLTGEQQNFIGGVEQLRSGLSLTALEQAKERGATFGALSKDEWVILSQSASRLGTWAQEDKDGNITGYNVSEDDFRKEMDKIKNFAKLDYLIKGGSPEDVGVVIQPDGTYWSLNSDGTYSQLR